MAQAQIQAEQDKVDLGTANYQTEKARLEASKRTIVSAIQGEESEIDLGLAEEKLKVQQASIDLHGKIGRSESCVPGTIARRSPGTGGIDQAPPGADGDEEPAGWRGQLPSQLFAGMEECAAV